MTWLGAIWLAEEPEAEPSPGMLFHRPDGIAGCPLCGWRGVPVAGRPHECPACQIAPQTDAEFVAARRRAMHNVVEQRVVEQPIGRNEPCWCGSARKFKRCHGA